ncbi:MAG TPA: nuclear transport factor 2 family protein [Steroidobacteraceae bacterium]|jgi:ketosteroid isomerase-like protein|nr:nuclear transport factor 2 family protein [Steroidobacteraceae bacterium]
MKFRVLMCLGLLNVVALPAISTEPRATESLADLAEQVRATEIAFAKTLADRDVKAFARMIAPDAIWLADAPLRGPAEVLTRWQKYFDAAQPPFSWAPELVEVQEGGKLALSTGPVTNAAGKRVGTYTSIWRREKSGEWRLIFDRGCLACVEK